GAIEELFAGNALDLFPQLVRPLKERNVRRVLIVGEPDDARIAVGRTEIMGHVKPLDAQDALVAAGKLVASGAAHAPDADDDGIIMLGVAGHLLAPPASGRWNVDIGVDATRPGGPQA